MEHRIILKCRVCLDECDEEKMFDLFVENSTDPMVAEDDNTLRSLADKVEFCCGVRMRQSPEMPTKICNKCFDMTRIWFSFRQMCLNSQVYLESLCKDRIRPPGLSGVNDSDYLEYLFEKLQTLRSDARYASSDVMASREGRESAMNVYEADLDDNVVEENEDDGDRHEYIEAVAFEAVDSDPEFGNIVENIKKEQEAEETEAEAEKKRLEQAEKRRKKQKKMRRYDSAPKIKYRAPSPSSYMCSICGNVYTKKASFTYHMALHSDVKPHECELCGKAFRQVCELKNHMRRHTGEKPYKCSYCDRHFTDRSEKHRHERVHTNTRPYVCNVCGKSFMYSAILKNHTKLHSGEKDYNCLVCQKAFTLQHQLKAHLQTLTHKQKEAQFVNAGYEVVYE